MNKSLEEQIRYKSQELIELLIQAGLKKDDICTSVSIAEFDNSIHIDAENINLVLDK